MNKLFREITPSLNVLSRLFLGGVFVTAGFLKLSGPIQNFQASLEEYTLLPYFLLPIIARVVPWVEWLSCSFVMVGYLRRISAAVLAVMCFGFVVLLLSRLLNGEAGKTCGCFGGTGLKLTVWQMLILDSVNLIFAVWQVLRRQSPLALDNLFLKKESGKE